MSQKYTQIYFLFLWLKVFQKFNLRYVGSTVGTFVIASIFRMTEFLVQTLCKPQAYECYKSFKEGSTYSGQRFATIWHTKINDTAY